MVLNGDTLHVIDLSSNSKSYGRFYNYTAKSVKPFKKSNAARGFNFSSIHIIKSNINTEYVHKLYQNDVMIFYRICRQCWIYICSG